MESPLIGAGRPDVAWRWRHLHELGQRGDRCAERLVDPASAVEEDGGLAVQRQSVPCSGPQNPLLVVPDGATSGAWETVLTSSQTVSARVL